MLHYRHFDDTYDWCLGLNSITPA